MRAAGFVPGCRGSARFQWVGVQPGTYFSAGPPCGFGASCGPGLVGNDWLVISLGHERLELELLMQRLSRLALVGIVAVTALLVGCSSSSTPTAAAASPALLNAEPDRTASVTNPSQAGLSQTNASHLPVEYIASGPIVVENQVDLAAQRDGVVAEILVEAGASVKKGQLLAKLD